MNKISVVAEGAIAAMSIAQDLHRIAANAMDAAESEKLDSGGDKKKWVLAYVSSVAKDLGYVWKEWVEKISKFIDALKVAYNALKYIF